MNMGGDWNRGAQVWQVKHDWCVFSCHFHVESGSTFRNKRHMVSSQLTALVEFWSVQEMVLNWNHGQLCLLMSCAVPSTPLQCSLWLPESEESQLLRLESDLSTGFSFSSSGTFLVSPSMATFSAYDTKCPEKSLVFDVRVFNKETRARCCIVCWCVCVCVCVARTGEIEGRVGGERCREVVNHSFQRTD